MSYILAVIKRVEIESKARRKSKKKTKEEERD
jgi:hypothetical protein